MSTQMTNSTNAATPKHGLLQRVKHHLNELILTSPSFLWMVIFFLIPTVLIFALSFRDTTPTGGIAASYTLETWANISNPSYPEIIQRTIWLSVLASLACILISIPCAFAIARASSKIRHIIVGLIILPFWTSFLIRVFAWKTLLHPEGAVTAIFKWLGIISPTAQALPSEVNSIQAVMDWIHCFLNNFFIYVYDTYLGIDPPQQLLYNAGAVLIVMIYTYLPFAILPLYAAAEKFDFSLIEAALDLGASPFRAFVQIFVPGIRVGIYSATLMVLIPALGSYVVPSIVGDPESSRMIGTLIYDYAIENRQLPRASALSTLLFLGVLIPPLVAWLFIRKRKINITETEVVEAAITEDQKLNKKRKAVTK